MYKTEKADCIQKNVYARNVAPHGFRYPRLQLLRVTDGKPIWFCKNQNLYSSGRFEIRLEDDVVIQMKQH
jgi:hypothetical protein